MIKPTQMNKRLLIISLSLTLIACARRPAQAEPQSSPGAGRQVYSFHRGYPDTATAQRAYDDADFQRAVTAYRFWYPMVSAEGIFNGNRAAGIEDNVAIGIAAAGPRQVGSTLNSDTPYGSAALDLTNGPMVIEIPPGPCIGLVDDHYQGWILDFGLPGPDAGKGGKHLILPPDYKGEVPPGYQAGRSSSFKILLALRALPIGGNVPQAMAALRKIKIYPFSTAAHPVALKFVDTTGITMDSTLLRWEDNIQFWVVLHRIIDANRWWKSIFRCMGCFPHWVSKRASPSPPMTHESHSGASSHSGARPNAGICFRQYAI